MYLPVFPRYMQSDDAYSENKSSPPLQENRQLQLVKKVAFSRYLTFRQTN